MVYMYKYKRAREQGKGVRKELHCFCLVENDANAINTMAKNAPEGSVYAQTQMLNSSVAQLDRNLGNLHNSMNKGFGLVGSWFKSQKMEEAVKQQETYNKEIAVEETMTTSAFGNEDD